MLAYVHYERNESKPKNKEEDDKLVDQEICLYEYHKLEELLVIWNDKIIEDIDGVENQLT